jgi:hypothetical protein
VDVSVKNSKPGFPENHCEIFCNQLEMESYTNNETQFILIIREGNLQ